jgi:hypothetical protein
MLSTHTKGYAGPRQQLQVTLKKHMCIHMSHLGPVQKLLEVMRSHLEVSLDESRAADDEDILGVHSGIVRRRVLR